MRIAAQKLAEEWDLPVEFVLEALEQTKGYWRWAFVADTYPNESGDSKPALRRKLTFRSDASARRVREAVLGLMRQREEDKESQPASLIGLDLTLEGDSVDVP